MLSHRHRSTCARNMTAIAMLAITIPAQARTDYLTLINDDDRTITEIEAAPAGTKNYGPLDTGGPLIGGRNGQATITLPAQPCRWDLRVVYRDNSLLTITGWDACRQTVVHVGAARQAAMRQGRPA